MIDTTNLMLTHDACDFLYKECPFTVFLDCSGYFVSLEPDFKAMLFVEVDGNYCVFSSDEKHPILKDSKVDKILKWLVKTGFLAYDDNNPFPEMAPYNNIKVNQEDAQIIPIYFKAENEELNNFLESTV